MFSTGVKLIGIDDFILPSKECTKPIDFSDSKSSVIKKSISATLADCLSCSGCVTSAEVIFVEQQGIKELQDFLALNKISNQPKTIIYSISPQSFVALMNKLELDEETCVNRISSFLRTEMDASFIFYTGLTNEICVRESCNEFIEFYNNRDSSSKNSMLISGVCPGWVCYAEKVQKDYVSYLSKVQSPQALMGSYIKKIFCSKILKNPSQIFHVTIMPCFDRKLEAFRPDLVVDCDGASIKEVDHVLATYELNQILECSKNFILKNLGFDDFFSLQNNYFHAPITEGNGSGGMAPKVFIYTCEKIFGLSVKFQLCLNGVIEWEIFSTDYKIETCSFRSTDFIQWSLVDKNKNELLKFAQIYGFKNIQNFVHRIKKSKNDEKFPIYVEIMACPGRGCLNGGAQFSPFNKETSQVLESRNQLKILEQLYESLPKISKNADLLNTVRKMHDELMADKTNLYRQFYKLENEKKMNIDW